MTPEELKTSLEAPEPPSHLTAPLTALWHAAKGDWDRAHGIVQAADGREADWVHAYLHRAEGDLSNAGYWYGRAGKDRPDTSLDTEWQAIVTALL